MLKKKLWVTKQVYTLIAQDHRYFNEIIIFLILDAMYS